MENVIDNLCVNARGEDIDFLQRCRRQLLAQYKPGQYEVQIEGASDFIVERFCADIASVGVRAQREGGVVVLSL